MIYSRKRGRKTLSEQWGGIMRAINLYVLTRCGESDSLDAFERNLSERCDNSRIREKELNQIKELVFYMKYYGAAPDCFDNWVYSFHIPQISKEFDLLKIGQNGVAVNIELKSQMVEKERIIKQLKQNRHYLSHICSTIHSLALVFDEDGNNKIYYYSNIFEELIEDDYENLIRYINEVENPIYDGIEKWFNPSQYLISPINTPDKFLNGDYFLNDQQETIKNKIICGLNTDEKRIWGIKGGAGTGKTLLLYDIAKECGNEYKVCVVHSGNLSEGHNKLMKLSNIFTIISARRVNEDYLRKFEVVLVDETQRLYSEDLDTILNLFHEGILKMVTFAYDYRQCLSEKETERNNPKRLEETKEFKELRLKENIRINRELNDFIERLFDTTKLKKYELGCRNIDIIYAVDLSEADELINIYQDKGYVFLSFTPSRYKDHAIDHFYMYQNSHDVIGQEFDNVMIEIDNTFSYDSSGKLVAKTHPNPDYLFTKLLYQDVTRAREKLCVLVIEDTRLLKKVLEIKNS